MSPPSSDGRRRGTTGVRTANWTANPASAAPKGWTGGGYFPGGLSLGNANLAASIDKAWIERSRAACAAASD